MAEQRKLYAMAFIDGQNLFQHAKAAFGHYHPNFDPIKLHQAICEMQGWQASLVHYYTGIPDQGRDPMWAGYWSARTLSMKRAGVHVTTRPLRYRDQQAYDEQGALKTVSVAQEKGVDVRMALDIVKAARTKQFDVAVIYSQDQDLNEVVAEIREIANDQKRPIVIASAFPYGPNASYRRGIDKTTWLKIDEATYNACLDHRDYRPKQ